jgi:hypothetical protein
MQEIEIRSRPGEFIIVDDDVKEVVEKFGWCDNGTGYYYAHLKGIKPYKKVLLHRMVIRAVTGQWPPDDMDIDHINHNKKDNQYSNLRIVTRSINIRNFTNKAGGSSKYSGVCLCGKTGKWYAKVHICIKGKENNIISSYTNDEIKAAMCADCIRYHLKGFLTEQIPDMTFKEKWAAIGEPQRKQILNSLKKNGFKAVGG